MYECIVENIYNYIIPKTYHKYVQKSEKPSPPSKLNNFVDFKNKQKQSVMQRSELPVIAVQPDKYDMAIRSLAHD